MAGHLGYAAAAPLVLFPIQCNHNRNVHNYSKNTSSSPPLPSPPALPTVVTNPSCSLYNTNTLIFQLARLLVPSARFEASKLKVDFRLQDKLYHRPPHHCCYSPSSSKEAETAVATMLSAPRIYILSHCDFTANLTLTISNLINLDQLEGWYNKDDVVAEWKQIGGRSSLHVHCYVSGPTPLVELTAEFRYHIFSKDLPLVLQAVLHGDTVLFKEHPELVDAVVWVYFHSSSVTYNRVECWGPLKDAAQGERPHPAVAVTGNVNSLGIGKWSITKSFLQALFSFLL